MIISIALIDAFCRNIFNSSIELIYIILWLSLYKIFNSSSLSFASFDLLNTAILILYLNASVFTIIFLGIVTLNKAPPLSKFSFSSFPEIKIQLVFTISSPIPWLWNLVLLLLQMDLKYLHDC